jgi:hypothetical protein
MTLHAFPTLDLPEHIAIQIMEQAGTDHRKRLELAAKWGYRIACSDHIKHIKQED